MELKHKDLTEKIIRVFYNVYNALGYGFLEKVYENSMAIELNQAGLKSIQQVPIPVYFRGAVVGEYFADLVIDNLVLVELKATSKLIEQHEAQLLNYLKATHYEIGLLLNFGPTPEFRRKAFDNAKKVNLRKSDHENPVNPRPIN
jgi:GxxExxY protein